MSITLTPQVEALVRQKMADGKYGSESDMIEHALEALDERERASHLRTLLQSGIDQADRGEVTRITDTFWDELDRDVDRRLLRGESPRPEVCP
jgi:putative addiction module CopG family antidote